ncbi:MAG: transcription antitermination factor NusB, partial [Rhodospirillaceae bacterium]
MNPTQAAISLAPRALEPRALALAFLTGVLRQGRTFDEMLGAGAGRSALVACDRNFVRLVVATALRRLGQIDAAIAAMLDRPGLLKPSVHDVLRLGAVQLLFLDTPAHAAVDTTVELAGANSETAIYKKLVNAVMRRLGREGRAVVAGQDAGCLNTPDWLWQSWVAAYGEACARAIADAHLIEAPLDISLKDPAGASLWAERLEARILPTGTLRRSAGGVVSELAGFGDGAWWIQDAAAALPAALLGDVRGARVFDFCAAPGGKTAQLAAAGARVVAVDRSARRLARLQA